MRNKLHKELGAVTEIRMLNDEDPLFAGVWICIEEHKKNRMIVCTDGKRLEI